MVGVAAGCATVSAQPAPSPPVIRSVTAAELGATWRPGCPVAPQGLRRVEVDYLGFDGDIHRGALVVNKDVVDGVVAIFGQLASMRYPIERMQTVDHYPLPGSTAWSLHAYGRAIDVNPLVNPYLDSAGDLQPKTAGRYLDRTRDDLGLLHPGDAAVHAFTDRGWRWGGAWRNPVDYQHFEVG